MWTWSSLPHRTPELPGLTGLVRQAIEDFRVDEVPAYEPCGEGPHVFVRVEKRDRTTEQVAAALATAAGVDPVAVGYAGQKDRRAVTTQWFSLPDLRDEAVIAAATLDGARILDVSRHTNRLKVGHVRANRFAIMVRTDEADAAARAGAVLRRLADVGAPNYFGPQRFGGRAPETLDVVALLGHAGGSGKGGRRRRYGRRMDVSTAQAFLFNAVLCRRMLDGLVDRAIAGDILKVRATGGLFVCADPATDDARLAAGELVTTGPVFGHKTMAPRGAAAAREQAVLDAAGLEARVFKALGKLAPGTRRPNLVFPSEPHAEPCPGGVRLTFGLPAGAYATVVLRELKGIPG